MFPTVLNNPGCVFRTASIEPSAVANRRGRLSPAIYKNRTGVTYVFYHRIDRFSFNYAWRTIEFLWVNDRSQEQNGMSWTLWGKLYITEGSLKRSILGSNVEIDRFLVTCILTLAVSKGNVAKSAIQAAVPAESNFIHKGNSSDACCFIVLVLLFVLFLSTNIFSFIAF